MDQRYKAAATGLEKIQKKHAKQIPDDVKAGLIGLISDLKIGAKSKNEVKTKFDTLERAIKTKKPDLWKLLEDIRNSLDIDSMGIFGASNSSIQSEERARADSEMAFMVECFRAILEILQDNGNTSIFPKPAERLTEKVSEGYGYASKVASLCKEQKSELDHMSKIIEDLYNQAVEGNDDLKQGKPEKPTTTSSNKGSTDKGKSVPKKPDPSMTSAIELKSTAVSSALKKTKGDLKRASKVIEDLYTQAVEVNEDQVQRREKPTATGSKKGSEDKGQTVPKKTEPDIASDLETKGTAVTLALTKMKGGLEHASKIIEDLYNQAVEGTDDKVQRKRETSTPTSSKKGSTDKGQTVPKKPEPDIASTIDMKGIAVSSALKNTKGDLKRASKIIQDLYTQAVEVNEDQVQRKIEKPTATGSKKGSEDKGQTVPKKTEPDIASDLETKGTAVTLALTKMKGGLEHASKIIEDLYNQAVEGTDDRAQRKQETSTPTPTSSKKGSTDKGQTVPKKPEPDIASTIEMKGIAVLSALKNMKGEAQYASRLLDQLYQKVIEVNGDQLKDQTDKPKKNEVSKKTKGKEDSQDQTKLEKYKVSKNDQIFESVLSTLMKMETTNSDVKRLTYEIESLEDMMADLKTCISEGGEKPVSLYASNEIKRESQAYESARQIFQMFKEIQRDMDFASRGLSQLVSLIKVDEAEKTQNVHGNRSQGQQHTVAGGQKSVPAPKAPPVTGSKQLNEDFQTVLSALREMKETLAEMKKKEGQVEKLTDEYDFLAGLLGALHESVAEGEDKLTKKQSSATTEKEYDRASKILRMFQDKEKETELTSKLLAELCQLSSAKDVEYLREKGQSPGGDNKKSQQRTPESALRTPGSHVSLNPQDNFEVVKSALHQLKVVQGEIEYASRSLEKLILVSDNVGSGDETVNPLTNTTSKVENSSFKTRDGGATESGQVKISLDENIAKVGELIKKQSREIYILKQKVIEAESDLHNSKISQEKILQDVKSLQTRLSEFASAKLTHNNPNIADLSDPNRPTKLQEQYSELYDNVWTDAFDKLSHASPQRTDRDITNSLLEIFTEGFLFCRQRREMQIRGLLGIIFHPESDIPSNQVEDADIKQNEVFEKHLTDSVKFGSDKAGENVAEAFFRKEDMQNKFGHQIQMNETYVKKSVKLCWLMQCQTPPVCIDLAAKPNDLFDKDTYKEYTKKGSKIDFIVWPPLRLHQGGPLLAKGVAQGK